ncbi:MAG: hypothetical protein M0Q91_07270 [Methanoregula sp.]|jgi:hypothetical protein|nr:hypothetical protein [Methanoregula sp.]
MKHGVCTGAKNAAIMTEERFLFKIVSCFGGLQVRYLLALLVGFAVMCGFAGAHTPSDVEVRYNELSGELAVTISHQVDNPATHYVKEVTIRQGTTVISVLSYTSQPDRSTFTYTFNLPQLKGSIGEIIVDAQCNQFGSRSGTLILTKTQLPYTPTTTLVPSDTQPLTSLSTKAGVLPFAAILAVGFASRRILR